MRLDLDIDAGTATLADASGNIRRYRRADEDAVRSKLCHATWDEGQGCAFRTKLLEADQFPEALFIMHRPPKQVSQTARSAGQWMRVFRYEPETLASDTRDGARHDDTP